jgi:regulatory protein
LVTKLRDRGIPDDAAERALDRLVQVGLIDDAAYAAAFVASRHRDRGLGRAALRRELERKGIDRELADRALEAIDADAERSRAAQMVAKKLDSAMYAGTDAARRRLLGMLARRGYSPAVAIAVVNDALRGFAEPWDTSSGDEPSA